MATPVREVDRADKRQLNDFIRLERGLVGDQPLFVGELDSDVRKRLAGESEFADGVEYTLFANEGARCVAIVNPLWRQPRTGWAGAE